MQKRNVESNLSFRKLMYQKLIFLWVWKSLPHRFERKWNSNSTFSWSQAKWKSSVFSFFGWEIEGWNYTSVFNKSSQFNDFFAVMNSCVGKGKNLKAVLQNVFYTILIPKDNYEDFWYSSNFSVCKERSNWNLLRKADFTWWMFIFHCLRKQNL